MKKKHSVLLLGAGEPFLPKTLVMLGSFFRAFVHHQVLRLCALTYFGLLRLVDLAAQRDYSLGNLGTRTEEFNNEEALGIINTCNTPESTDNSGMLPNFTNDSCTQPIKILAAPPLSL
jgi:hypothetical protein